MHFLPWSSLILVGGTTLALFGPAGGGPILSRFRVVRVESDRDEGNATPLIAHTFDTFGKAFYTFVGNVKL